MPGRLDINVGGRVFSTTKGTLSYGGHGYFAAAFERWEEGSNNAQQISSKRQRVADGGGGEDDQPAEPEIMFVDRSPELFEHVLAWLRSSRLPSRVRCDPLLLNDLQEEGRFYALDGLVGDCEEALRALQELFPSPSARSFCEVVNENARVVIKAKPGQVVYLQTAVLGGDCSTGRIVDKDPVGDEDIYAWAENRIYLRSGVKGADGDFQLLVAAGEDSYVYSPVVHRCLDDAAVEDNHSTNLDLSNPVDLVFDNTVKLMGKGNATWHVFGWVGDRDAIPPLMANKRRASPSSLSEALRAAHGLKEPTNQPQSRLTEKQRLILTATLGALMM